MQLRNFYSININTEIINLLSFFLSFLISCYPTSLHAHDTWQVSPQYEKCIKMESSISGWTHRLLCHPSLPLCSSFPTSLSLSLYVTHAPPCFILYCSWWHACQSLSRASRASPPAAPGSLNQAGLAWLGLIGGQSRQQRGGSLSGGATGGNVETEKKK